MAENFEMKMSTELHTLAEQAARTEPIESTVEYTLHPFPKGFMDHFVLWLWEEGQDFPGDRLPEGFEMPIEVDGRRGYVMEKSRADAAKRGLKT